MLIIDEVFALSAGNQSFITRYSQDTQHVDHTSKGTDYLFKTKFKPFYLTRISTWVDFLVNFKYIHRSCSTVNVH